jgi:hypothetical protein
MQARTALASVSSGPAGDEEGGLAALAAGSDAVVVGVETADGEVAAART